MQLFTRAARRIRRPRITYANVASTLALFMAISGVAWAASLPKNSVGHKQIKKNAVRASEIKKNAVRASEINKNAVSTSEAKNDGLKGVDIDESSLAKVPSASASDTVATEIGPIAKRIQSTASAATRAAARAAATEVPLLTHGQITLYMKCFVDTGTNFLWGEILMRTSADGAVAISTDDDYDGNAAFLNVATSEDTRVFDSISVANDDADNAGDDRAAVIGPDGNGLHLQVSSWAKHGAIPGASSLVTGTDQCYFAVNGSKVAPPS